MNRPPALALSCLVLLQLSLSSRAAEEKPAISALDLVPADAAFFTSWSRQGEQFNALRRSQAFADLIAIPRVREVLGPLLLGQFDKNNPAHVTMKQWLSQPFIQVGLGALRHEIFVYGDAEFTAMVDRCRHAIRASDKARLEATAAGKTNRQAELASARAIVCHLHRLHVPGLVVGFKADDPMRARVQLMLLDGLLHIAMAGEDVPPWVRENYGRETIQGQQFLTFTLTGSVILDQMEFKAPSWMPPRLVKAAIDAAGRLKLTFAVGMIDDYVILSLGESTEHLQRLGQSPPLADHADLARIRQREGEPFTSIRYVGSAYRTALAAFARVENDLEQRSKRASEENESPGENERAEAQRILKALQTPEKLSQRKASLGFAYLTADGYEGFSYEEAEPGEEPTRPMSVLLHVGAEPIGVVARRVWVDSVEDYVCVSRHLAEFLAGLEGWWNTEGEQEQLLRQEYGRLVADLDRIMHERIVPALAGGEAGLVFSASEGAVQWYPDMPPSKKTLSLLDVGLVVETNDLDELLTGILEAWKVVRAGLQLTSNLAEEIPPLTPQTTETEHGRLHYLPLWPELTRIDPNLAAPTVGLSDHWLVLSLRPKTAANLLQPTGWTCPEVTPDEARTLTSVIHVRPAALASIVLDWLDYAEQTLMDNPSDDDVAVLEIYRSVIRLAACLKSYTRTVRRDGDLMVTHSVWRFEDR